MGFFRLEIFVIGVKFQRAGELAEGGGVYNSKKLLKDQLWCANHGDRNYD